MTAPRRMGGPGPMALLADSLPGGALTVAPPGPYPANCASWLTIGPFDLSDATAASVTFHAWLDTEQPFDEFMYGLSRDDRVYEVEAISGWGAGGWQKCPGGILIRYDMSDFLGDTSVWWGLIFESDNMVEAEGVYVDDVILKKTTPQGTVKLITEGFEGAWPGSWSIGGACSGSAWGTTSHRAHSGALSAYCVGGPTPTIRGSRPVLAWDANSPTGIKPMRKAPGAVRTFKVLYADADGDPPDFVKCVIQRLTGRETWGTYDSFDLQPKSGDYRTGCVHQRTRAVGRGIFRYRFRASDDEGMASGEPTKWRLGPKVIAPPTLFWSGLTGRVRDGVNPDSRKQAGEFRFGVAYADSEGDPPKVATLRIQRKHASGVWKSHANYDCAAASGSLKTGRVYHCVVDLPEGDYRYRFVFTDNDGLADGKPAEFKRGPKVGK